MSDRRVPTRQSRRNYLRRISYRRRRMRSRSGPPPNETVSRMPVRSREFLLPTQMDLFAQYEYLVAEMKPPEPIGGYPKEMFVSAKAISNLECGICHMVARNPITACAEEHVFCESCWKEHERMRTQEFQPLKCPMDRQLITDPKSIKPSALLRRMCHELDIKCSNEKDLNQKVQCTWKGQLGQLQRHLDTQCEFETVPCPLKCGTQVVKLKMEAHERDECPNGIVSCRNEKSGCGKTFKRSETTSRREHLTVCDFRTERCLYEQFGCRWRGLAKNVSQHLANKQMYHVRIQLDNQHKLERKVGHMQEKIQKLQEELETLREQKSNSQ